MNRIAIALLFACASASAAERPLIANKSEIGFSVKQMGVAVSGDFKRFSAKIDLDSTKPEAASAEIAVDVASVSTGTDEGDQTAVDKAWLDASGFPKATFKSSAVRSLGGDRYEAKGLLSIKGKPREITVPFTLTKQPDGGAIVAGDFRIQRTDFGIGAAQGCASAAGAGCAGAAGGEWNDLVANEVPIHFRLTLNKESK